MVRAPLTLATISGLLIGATATAQMHPPPSSWGWDNLLLLKGHNFPSTIQPSKSSFGIQHNRFNGALKERIMADLKIRRGSSLQGLLSLRGGENLQVIDLERVDLRLGSLEEYCLIASIILGAVIGTFFFYAPEVNHMPISDLLVFVVCLLIMTIPTQQRNLQRLFSRR